MLDISAKIKTIQDLYLCDDIPWAVGYSGGKDSTAVLQLVWIALELLDTNKLTKPIYIINTDTLVESPIISAWVRQSLKQMDQASKIKNLPIKTIQLNPDINNTFWVNLIGRGYPFPRKKVRWCTDRLKIKPVNNFIKKQIEAHGEVIMVLGTRKAESTNRKKSMEKYEKLRVRELLSPNPTMANEFIFTPLEDWNNEDVWTFLMQYKNPWGYDNTQLLDLYNGATADSECPMMVDKDLPTCGNSRFGCWVCTMVKKDKSMEALINNDKNNMWLTPLLEFRNYFGDEGKDRGRREFRKSKGNLKGGYGRLYHGAYKKEIREKWLKKLLELQNQLQATAPEEYKNIEIITLDELKEIRKIWVMEKHEWCDTLPSIYKQVTGQDFIDPTFKINNKLNKKEFDLLGQTCYNNFKDEKLLFEMLYKLIDIQYNKEEVNELINCIKKTFYKDEQDALEYYTKINIRKKELGASYDEKFFMEGKNENN